MARFEFGWGWSLAPDIVDRSINGSIVHVIPDVFLTRDQKICAFTGKIVTRDHLLGGRQMLAIPMSMGDHWDFTDHVCPAWRFYFGPGELAWPLDSWPRLVGTDVDDGYGAVAEHFEKASPNTALEPTPTAP